MPTGTRPEPEQDPAADTRSTTNPAAGPLPLGVLFLVLIAIGLAVLTFVVMRTAG